MFVKRAVYERHVFCVSFMLELPLQFIILFGGYSIFRICGKHSIGVFGHLCALYMLTVSFILVRDIMSAYAHVRTFDWNEYSFFSAKRELMIPVIPMLIYEALMAPAYLIRLWLYNTTKLKVPGGYD
jgi:hypothetical protein